MIIGIGDEIFLRQEQESPRGSKTAAVLRVIGMQILKPQVDEATCELDESLVKGMVGMPPPLTEPEILEHIVRLVVETRVEALEVSREMRIDAATCVAT